MFKFNFQLDDEDTDAGPSFSPTAAQARASISPVTSEPTNESQRCYQVTLDDLLETLPETLSYSPIHHPALTTPLLRRDLFDARFQLISSIRRPRDDDAGPNGSREEEYVDAKTDLIPGLYEGGLKTWEGGMDLVEVLAFVEVLAGWVRGSRVLEVGCGTALPTAYILRALLPAPTSASAAKTTLRVQDYNLPVLKLVTLPNLILAALPYLPPESLRSPEDAGDLSSAIADLEQPGDLSITPSLKTAFKALLEEKGVELTFSYGNWTGLARDLKDAEEGYGLVMTAETIYAEDSVDSLIDVLRAPSSRPKGVGSGKEEVVLEEGMEKLYVRDEWAKRPLREGEEGVVLVAAKVLYFGVGGGLQHFLHRVEEGGGWSSVVKEWMNGVGRKVVRIGW